MDRFAAHIEANRGRYFDELYALLRQPSIAAQGIGIDETAAMVVRRLEQLGARVHLLRADGCLWETGGRNALEQPTINCGAKGICYVELVARGASHDLHSSNATVVPNPAWRLTWALSTLKGPDERILIPGFYDRVRPPSEADLRALESVPLDDEALLADFGISEFLGGVHGIERLKTHLF